MKFKIKFKVRPVLKSLHLPNTYYFMQGNGKRLISIYFQLNNYNTEICNIMTTIYSSFCHLRCLQKIIMLTLKLHFNSGSRSKAGLTLQYFELTTHFLPPGVACTTGLSHNPFTWRPL